MTRGRNTTMLGLRIQDELMDAIDAKAKRLHKTRSELLIPVVARFVGAGVVEDDGLGVSRHRVVPPGWGVSVTVRDEPDGYVMREELVGPERKIRARWIRDDMDGYHSVIVVRDLKYGPEFKVPWDKMDAPIMPEEVEKIAKEGEIWRTGKAR